MTTENGKNTIQEVQLTVGTGLTDSTSTENIELRTDMTRCYGVSVVLNSLASGTAYYVSIQSKDGTINILDRVNGKVLEVGSSIAPAQKHYPVNFRAAGKTLKVSIQVIGTTSGTFSADVQFHLVNDEAA